MHFIKVLLFSSFRRKVLFSWMGGGGILDDTIVIANSCTYKV